MKITISGWSIRPQIRDAHDLLLAKLTIDTVLQVIDAIATAASKAKLETAADEALVAFKLQQTAADLARLDERWEENKAELARRKRELEREPILGGLLEFVQTAVEVAALVGAFYGNVAALAAIPGAIVKFGGLLGTQDNIIEDMIDFSKPKPELRKEAKEAFDDVGSFFNTKQKLFDAAKTVAAIGKSTADETLNKLLKEQAQLLVDKAKLATVAQEQALEMNVVRVRKEGEQALTEQALAAARVSRETEDALTDLCFRLIMRVRLYADTVHRYNFQAARALQRWVFDESQPAVFFGFGWVDPDLEAELLDAPKSLGSDVQRHKAVQDAIVAYLQGLQHSVDHFDFGDLLGRYEQSVKSAADRLQYESLLVRLSAAERQDLTGNGATTFTVAIDDLPAIVRREAHVENVFSYFEPASEFTVEVAADPQWAAMLQDGSTTSGEELGRPAAVHPSPTTEALDEQVADELAQLRRDGPAVSSSFWGCSPCRRWSVRVRGDDQLQIPEFSDVRIALVLSGHDAEA